MREIFDNAYTVFCEECDNIVVGAVAFLKVVEICLIYLILPIWAIPYAILKRGSKDDEPSC